MRWCIENDDGKVYEVTNLFDCYGQEIFENAEQACACVIAVDDQFIATEIQGPIHRVQ